jgi:flagellar assembly protein FliH
MGRPLPLESFALRDPAGATPTYSAAELEAARLDGYDAGYRAGWDDAAAAHGSEQDRIGEDFARNLRDLSFTYHEARGHVTSGVAQVLRAFVDGFFPALVAEALAARVLESLEDDIDLAARQPVRLQVSPRDAPVLRRLLVSVGTLPCEIDEEPTLAQGQLLCRLGARELEVDLDAALAAARDALDALNDATTRTLRHG